MRETVGMLLVQVARWSYMCTRLTVSLTCILSLQGNTKGVETCRRRASSVSVESEVVRTKRAFSRHCTTSGGSEDVTSRLLLPSEAAALSGICDIVSCFAFLLVKMKDVQNWTRSRGELRRREWLRRVSWGWGVK